MMSHHLGLVLALLVALPLFASAAGLGGRGLVGGWTPIKNLKDPDVVRIGEFAVSEYDKESGGNLKFLKVVKGQTQVVAGIKYKLVVAATSGSSAKHYEAVVWEKSWEHFIKLLSFNPVSQ